MSAVVSDDIVAGVTTLFNTATALAAPILATATSITVTGTLATPQPPPFQITIGAEQLQVTAGYPGLAWTVTRGFNGTTPAAAIAGAAVLGPAASIAAGGLWHQRPAAATAWPYVVAMAKAGAIWETSGKAYMQEFTLTLELWDKTASPITEAGSAALDALMRRNPQLVVPNADQVLWCKAKGGMLAKAPKQSNAQTVLVATGVWEIRIQATRP